MLSKLVTPLLSKITIGLGCLSMVMAGVIFFQYRENQKLLVDSAREIAEARAAVDKAQEAEKNQLKAYYDLLADNMREETERKRQKERFDELEAKYSELQVKFDSYRDRWTNVVMARPDSVTRLATAATNKWLRDLACATGSGSDGCREHAESSPRLRPAPASDGEATNR